MLIRYTRQLVSLFILCLLGPSAQAGSLPLLELEHAENSLRFALPDEVYRAGVSPNFSHLQVTDAAGRNLSFAVCPIVETKEQFVAAALIEAPDTARVITQADGQLALQFSTGAKHPGTIQEWIIDLRELDDAINAIAGLPPIAQIRSGPNLSQWSRALSFQQTGDRIEFEAIRSSFFRLRLQSEQTPSEETLSVQVRLQRRAQERTPHWYVVSADEAGIYHNPRQLPVIAARIDNPSAQAWELASRQGKFDAWKPRTRVPAGQMSASSFFSAVTDPQWQLSGSTERLELAHPAHEMRLPRLEPGQTVVIHLRDDADFGPSLSCRTTESLPTRKPTNIKVLSEATSAPDEYTNLRGGFLILLSLVLGSVWLRRHYRRDASKR